MTVQQNTAQLIELAGKVLPYYGITPEGLKIIQSKGLKTLWKFSYNASKLCLKRLRHSEEKALFSVYGQIHIENNGGRVPSVIKNIEGSAITRHEGQLFVMYSWIDGRDLDFNKPEDLAVAVEGLAKVHKASVGYHPPNLARVSSKLGRWPDQYRSMCTKLSEWKEAARLKQQPRYEYYLKHVDGIIDIANRAIKAIDNSDYQVLTGGERNRYPLCHQDYGEGNVLLADEGVYVLDFDGVTYDLVVRDLRKIIGKRMEDGGGWDKTNIKQILKWYEKGNKLSAEEKKLLTIDLMFPHWFYGEVKDLYKKNKPVEVRKIERAAAFEQSKVSVLQDMPGGDML